MNYNASNSPAQWPQSTQMIRLFKNYQINIIFLCTNMHSAWWIIHLYFYCNHANAMVTYQILHSLLLHHNNCISWKLYLTRWTKHLFLIYTQFNLTPPTIQKFQFYTVHICHKWIRNLSGSLALKLKIFQWVCWPSKAKVLLMAPY